MKLTVIALFVIAAGWTLSAQRPAQRPIDEKRAQQLYVSSKSLVLPTGAAARSG